MRLLRLLSFTALLTAAAPAQQTDIFSRENLVAWCIVPFDAKKRDSEQRAQMLDALKIKRLAYDYRAEHIPTFDTEVAAMKKHGIEFTAWWFPGALNDEARTILAVIERHKITPQLWITGGGDAPADAAARIEQEAARLRPIAEAAAKLGCKVALYNHGGWFGEPENQAAIIGRLARDGVKNAGIVYNFHHGHAHLPRFDEMWRKMQPHLLAVNLNGMIDDGERAGKKILHLGEGEREMEMMRTIRNSGWRGPVGIIDHRPETDSAETLAANLRGFDWLVAELKKPGSGKARPFAIAQARSAVAAAPSPRVPARFGHALDARRGGIVTESKPDFIQPPLSIECWARLEKKSGYNILIASEPKSSPTHWELYTEAAAGTLSFYAPGAQPSVIASQRDVCDGQWHRVAAVYEANRVRLFVDSAPVADVKIARNAAAPAGPRHIAFGQLVESGLGCAGLVDEVHLRRGAHPPVGPEDEAPKPDASTLALWHFDEAKDFVSIAAMPPPKKPASKDDLPEKQTETDWIDNRWNETDLGSFHQAVITLPDKTQIRRGLAIRTGENTAVAYDLDTMTLRAKWNGDFVKFGDRRFGLMEGALVKQHLTPSDAKAPAGKATFRGLHVRGPRVILDYEVSGTRVLDMPGADGIERLAALPPPAAPRWQPLTTRGTRAADTDAYVIDTLTVPYENPWKALMFTSGVDFLPSGDAAVCTIHGDVWLVSGIDEKLDQLTWRRFATGLHQPLGLRVRDGKIFVLCRDQIVRLHDENADGEADFYECFAPLDTSAGSHDYVTSLELDRAGNFYYADPKGLHRIGPDGKSHELLSTGFRNPNGAGVNPDGTIFTVAPQQGNWTPSSAIWDARPGVHGGMGGPRVTPERPRGYDAPLCWLPHAADNSGGSQVWTPAAWGPLGGKMLHLSFGRCAWFLVLREEIGKVAQGGIAPLKGRFLSGSMRGSFNPRDGQLYVVGSRGWQTSGVRDGCLQRVRFTGKKLNAPVALHAHANGLRVEFTEPLDKEAAEDAGSYSLQRWNYKYAEKYGSADWSVADPAKQGRDDVEIKSARVLADGRSVFLEIPGLTPAMQYWLQYSLKPASGPSFKGDVYHTITATGAEFQK